MALVLAPEPPLEDWLDALDAQISRSPSFFDGRPVVLDLGALPSEQPNVAGLLHRLNGRGIRIIGTEGAHPSWEGLEPWGPLHANSTRPRSRSTCRMSRGRRSVHETTSLLIDQPVRSGQSIVFEKGDVTVVGSVASGAEVIAGGSIHVYGALRGRAIAGLTGNTGRASSAASWKPNCWRSTASTRRPMTWTRRCTAGRCRPGSPAKR